MAKSKMSKETQEHFEKWKEETKGWMESKVKLIDWFPGSQWEANLLSSLYSQGLPAFKAGQIISNKLSQNISDYVETVKELCPLWVSWHHAFSFWNSQKAQNWVGRCYLKGKAPQDAAKLITRTLRLQVPKDLQQWKND